MCENINCKLCGSSISSSSATVCYSKNKKYKSIFEEQGISSACICPGFNEAGEDAKGVVDINKALTFMFSGNAEFVLFDDRNKCRNTFKIEKRLTTNEETVYYVNIGHMNCIGFKQFGGILYFDSQYNKYCIRGEKINNATAKLLVVINSLNNRNYDIPVRIYHRGKCGMCGKEIRSDNKNGIGPICCKKQIA